MSLKKGDFNTPPVNPFFRKENGGFDFSKPPLGCYIILGAQILTRPKQRFFYYPVIRGCAILCMGLAMTIRQYNQQYLLVRSVQNGKAFGDVPHDLRLSGSVCVSGHIFLHPKNLDRPVWDLTISAVDVNLTLAGRYGTV